jgi:N-acetylglucosaminyl-diphospho-decaprenol L-rhamnosyltransferase
MPLGSIIIVTHNSDACIEPCLRSVPGRQDWKVIVVDNASSDASVSRARQVSPDVIVLANSDNQGFAAAINQAASISEGNTLLVLNPDAVASPGALDLLHHALEANDVGAVAGILVDDGGTVEKGFTVRRFPRLIDAIAEVLLVNRIWPRNPWNRVYRCLDLNYSHPQEVEQPAGACLAIKREVFEELGGFDKDFYPVWFEDVDFCRRLRSRGWKILFYPQAVFFHAGGHSVRKLGFKERQVFWYSNFLRYFAKHHSQAEVLCLRIAIAAGLLLRACLSLLGAGHKGVPVADALHGYWHAFWKCAVVGRSARSSQKSRPLPSPVS